MANSLNPIVHTPLAVSFDYKLSATGDLGWKRQVHGRRQFLIGRGPKHRLTWNRAGQQLAVEQRARLEAVYQLFRRLAPSVMTIFTQALEQDGGAQTCGYQDLGLDFVLTTDQAGVSLPANVQLHLTGSTSRGRLIVQYLNFTERNFGKDSIYTTFIPRSRPTNSKSRLPERLRAGLIQMQNEQIELALQAAAADGYPAIIRPLREALGQIFSDPYPQIAF
jgi:hypothetical protein